MSRGKRLGSTPRITGSLAWIVSGAVLVLFGGLFLALVATTGHGPTVSPQGWFMLLFAVPVGAVVFVIGLVKRLREHRRRDRR